jgi:alkylation response protein AidB-like acyl-CoA dehydrogenase
MTSSADPFKSNLRDVFFNLFDVLDVGHTSCGKAPFAAMDEDTARESLKALERLGHEKLSKSFAESDRVPLRLDKDGNVFLPEGLKQSFQDYYDAEAHLLNLPEHMGGLGAPPSIGWAGFDFLAAANATLAFYLFGTFAARTIDRLGTPEQKRLFLEPLVNKRWGASMVLTEPDAGSDVGAGRTTAKDAGNGIWEISGVKRFITNGDFDGVDNIVHMVLARPEGAAAGTKGLSLFLVPKFWVNDDGSIGERNGVYCTNIEKKMGIKGSATCELTFGDRGPARGVLLGGVHDGIRQMFHVIEQARMAVGIKSASTLSVAYLHALDYAKERVQGPDLLRAAEKSSPRVAIIKHPDVRRMLISQKAHAEGMRALCLYTAWIQDQVEINGGHGAAAARDVDHYNDMLLPLVKGYCSEKAYEQLALSLQVFGGSGYCQDYPVEQYLRDQKIDSLYEGTTHIQALDLFFRKVAKDGGQTLQRAFSEINKTLETKAGGDALTNERAALERALGDVKGIYGAMMTKVSESLYHVGLQGNRILFATAELLIGWLLVRHAAVAQDKLAGSVDDEKAFLEGKIASARWYTKNVLPALTLTRKLVEQSSLELMELPDAAF